MPGNCVHWKSGHNPRRTTSVGSFKDSPSISREYTLNAFDSDGAPILSHRSLLETHFNMDDIANDTYQMAPVARTSPPDPSLPVAASIPDQDIIMLTQMNPLGGFQERNGPLPGQFGSTGLLGPSANTPSVLTGSGEGHISGDHGATTLAPQGVFFGRNQESGNQFPPGRTTDTLVAPLVATTAGIRPVQEAIVCARLGDGTWICTKSPCQSRRFSRYQELTRHQNSVHERAQIFMCRTSDCIRARRGFPRRDKRDCHERRVHGSSHD